MKRASDLSPRAFRDRLAELGFAYLGGSADCFIDLRDPRPGRTVAPVKDSAGKMLRARSLAACLDARGKAAKARAAADERAARRARIAEAIAPKALPPARAALTEAAAIAQMAEDFRMMATRADGVTFKDLILAGWSEAQIREHADAARRLGYLKENGAAA